MSLFIDAINPAESAYFEVRLHYADGDYNAQYLINFEEYIDDIFSENLLATHPAREQLKNYPLPPSTARNQIIPREVYKLYLTFYRKVLRDIHAIGGFDNEEQQGMMESGEKTIDPFADYRKREDGQ